MILQINKQQAATLLLHLVTMRSSYRNLLKNKYKSDLKTYLTAYDYIKDEAAYAVENELESYDIHCNIIDLKVLQAFLVAYIPKLSTELKKANISTEDNQLILLQSISDSCGVLISA